MKQISIWMEWFKRRGALLGTDVIALSLSCLLSFHWFQIGSKQIVYFYLIFLSVKILFFIRLGLYHAILRFAGLPLASTILKATTFSSLICFFLTNIASTYKLPTGFFVTDYLATTFLMGLIRFAPRYFSESWREVTQDTKRTLIYGAGEIGEEVARKILRNPKEHCLIGFIDDEPTKIGKRVHNLPILGSLNQLNQLLLRYRIAELIIAISSLTGEEVRKISRECRRYRVFCRIVPTFSDMLKKDVDIKNIDIKDLLKREPKDLDEPQIKRFIRGKTVLITGAGGSIGAELTRQCIRYETARLILIDHSEFNLYSLMEEFSPGKIPMKSYLMNVLANGNLEKIMREEKPSIVFHAAAYKHVPIVEQNPFEGVQNNVRGTIETARLSEMCGVEKFIMISTDKAVRPTSIMGASKRISELYIQNLNARSKTDFIAVRFGNVLGSSGSVIPKFIDQINRGGPVTVTHPEVTRYFMLISEAVQLVLQAASIGNGGEIFILNMGRPIRIADMAEDLIYLSGREPHKEIKIEFTGLRPGEKLYEELLIDETEKKTQYENITIARATYLNWNQLTKQIESLLSAAERRDRWELLRTLKNIVPEFIHAEVAQYPNEETLKVITLPL